MGVNGWIWDELRHFKEWLERYPDIPSVLVHGMPTFSFADADQLRLPKLLVEILREHLVYAEVLYPISCGRQMEYPYQRLPLETGLRSIRRGPSALGFGYAQRREVLHLRAVADVPVAALRLYRPRRSLPHPRWKRPITLFSQ